MEEPVINTELNESNPITICMICNSQNLIRKTYLNKCSAPDCSNVYCLHYASPIDPQLCLYCLSDVVCHIEVKNPYSYSRRYRSIKFSGLDWLFQQRKISTLNDTELQVAIEYHRAILSGMVNEREERRINHFHRNKGKGASNILGQVPSILGVSSVKASNTGTEVRKTRTTTIKSPADVQSQVTDILAKLTAKGVSLEALAGILGRK